MKDFSIPLASGELFLAKFFNFSFDMCDIFNYINAEIL